MPHSITTVKPLVTLPGNDGQMSLRIDAAGSTVILTDAQYALIPQQAFSPDGWLTDNGPVAVSGDAVIAQGSAVAAPAALTSSQNATAAASDLTTSEALANALKTSYNALQADVAALHTTVAALVTNLSGSGKALAP